MKKIWAVLLLSLFLTGCVTNQEDPVFENDLKIPSPTVASTPTPSTAPTPIRIEGHIGISIPLDFMGPWEGNGNTLKGTIEKAGGTVDLRFADNNSATQEKQIEEMILEGIDVLIVAPVDGYSLSAVLKKAKEASILIIAFDRLVMGTDAIDYYVAFDNEIAGALQGQYIVDSLGLTGEDRGSYTMEVFAGAPNDNNSQLFFKGAMDVLSPYIKSGTLVIKSGQGQTEDAWKKVAMTGWETDKAKIRMDKLLKSYYTDENIDAILCPNDSLARGIVASLEAAGYGAEGKPFPILTGQDGESENIENIIEGKQSMTVIKDTKRLVDRTMIMIWQALSGDRVETNAGFNNDAIDVPSYLEIPIFVDANSY